MIVLGINAYHGDAAAALVRDGVLVAAAEEERFNRVKHCAGFPVNAVKYCLREAGIDIRDVDHIAISRDPSANLMDKILFTLTRVHKMTSFIKDRLSNVSKVRDVLGELAAGLGVARSQIRAPLHNVEHHLCHMASAFLVSPFEEAACLSIDGFGDFVSTMMGRGQGSDVRPIERIEFPHSLGVFYTMVTQYLGFPKYGDEGKVMGLAPYGKPVYLDKMAKILRVQRDGTFELGLDYFRHDSEGVEMSWDEGTPKIGRIFSDAMVRELGPAREPGQPLTPHYENVAASLQKALEEAIFALLNRLHSKVPSRNLSLAGGVALNSVTNGMIFDRTPFREVFIQPAAGDAGTAVGAAFYVATTKLGGRRGYVMRTAYTGPGFSHDECHASLAAAGLAPADCADPIGRAADLIADGKVVGWFQGRMEFGPRALGNRSILADPRKAEMKDILNARVKHREPFRPFAPVILAERTGDYFEKDYPSPFMLLVYNVREEKRAEVPAITHVDGTGRLQTVSADENAAYYNVVRAFGERTGTPVLLNTSFNENEPIVCTPADAIRCWQTTKMDALFLGDVVVERSA
jgi:carbamoyltransferase